MCKLLLADETDSREPVEDEEEEAERFSFFVRTFSFPPPPVAADVVGVDDVGGVEEAPTAEEALESLVL